MPVDGPLIGTGLCWQGFFKPTIIRLMSDLTGGRDKCVRQMKVRCWVVAVPGGVVASHVWLARSPTFDALVVLALCAQSVTLSTTYAPSSTSPGAPTLSS